jgi:hypothetical protein
MEKYGRVGQTAVDNKMRRMSFACWIIKATDTYLEYAKLLFHCNSGYANAPQCCVIRTVLVWLVVTAGSVQIIFAFWFFTHCGVFRPDVRSHHEDGGSTFL